MAANSVNTFDRYKLVRTRETDSVMVGTTASVTGLVVRQRPEENNEELDAFARKHAGRMMVATGGELLVFDAPDGVQVALHAGAAAEQARRSRAGRGRDLIIDNQRGVSP